MIPKGVAVTTVTDTDGRPYGITVSSFTGLSLEPPLVLCCIGQGSRMVPMVTNIDWFAVNVLSSDQKGLSIQFSGNWDDRFNNVDWYPGKTGAPLLRGSVATLECRRTEILARGDHVIVIGEVCATGCYNRQPLAYVNRAYGTVTVE